MPSHWVGRRPHTESTNRPPTHPTGGIKLPTGGINRPPLHPAGRHRSTTHPPNGKALIDHPSTQRVGRKTDHPSTQREDIDRQPTQWGKHQSTIHPADGHPSTAHPTGGINRPPTQIQPPKGKASIDHPTGRHRSTTHPTGRPRSVTHATRGINKPPAQPEAHSPTDMHRNVPHALLH